LNFVAAKSLKMADLEKARSAEMPTSNPATPADDKDRQPQLGEKPKPGRQQHGQGGDPRSLPGSEDLGDQSEPQDKGGMVKGT
jgi:hypothetical protein